VCVGGGGTVGDDVVANATRAKVTMVEPRSVDLLTPR
jgi:hypothetical protein